MSERGSRRFRLSTLLALVVAAVVVQANSCSVATVAKNYIWPEVEAILDQNINQGRNWRLHWMEVSKGTVVSSLELGGIDGIEPYTCRGRRGCLLFFLDLDPFAHFAHPTRILVFDPNPAPGKGPVATIGPTEWWPTVLKPGADQPEWFFSTVAEREDPSSILYHGIDPDELPLPNPDYVFDHGPIAIANPGSSGHLVHPTPTPAPGPGGPSVVCDTSAVPVWAILVNGYDDKDDSFDEDVSGMFAVLTGFQVPEDRIKVLSPFKPVGVDNWIPSSKAALMQAFLDTKNSMVSCSGLLGGKTPHFLLFWSSHGTDLTLYCKLASGNINSLAASEINQQLISLENEWISGTSGGSTDLAVTVVIEACKSESVGKYLHLNNGAHRRILSSASKSSYRDIDETLISDSGPVPDPNPADAGSETIWGYVEAFGSRSPHIGDAGWESLSFERAVQYAKDNDVTYLGQTVLHSREIASWSPAGSLPVHGADNTTQRVNSQVYFSSPVSTQLVAVGGPAEVQVRAGETLKIELAVDHSGTGQEVGALALRFFKNSEPAPDDWKPVYYDVRPVMRTTTMVPGLFPGSTYTATYEVKVPDDLSAGERIRLAVVVDSGQQFPVGITSLPDPKTEIVLVVEEDSNDLCGWLKAFLEWLAGLFGAGESSS